MSNISRALPKISLPNVIKDVIKSDPVQRATDFVSTAAFEKFRPQGDPATLTGANRVAYGPLDAAPTLKRPVVMVPGFTMEANSFDRMAKQLASNPANGPVAVYVAKDQKFHQGAANGPVMTSAQVKAAKIFEVQYQDPFTGPTVKAKELAGAFDAVKAATGGVDVDAVTHSEGGTDLRLYLDSRKPGSGPNVAHAVLIGSASHGTEVGNLGEVFGGVVKHANVAAGELAVGSPLNQRLLANWDSIRAQAKDGFTVIGVTGAPTLDKGDGFLPYQVVDGDGFMPARDLALPGANTVTMKGPHNTPAAHLWEVQYSGVINQAMGVLGS
jgi:hypothetical protein